MNKDSNKKLIDDKSFARFKDTQHIKKLQVLSIKGSKVTSKELNQFLASENALKLEVLKMSWNFEIDDSVLNKIKKLPLLRLKKMYFNETGITNLAVEEFQ